MKLLTVIFLVCVLQDFVIGRTVVKRNCNSSCCQSNNCNNRCNSNSQSNCNNCCTSNNCQSNNCNNQCNSNCNNDCQDCEPEEPQVPVLVPFPPASNSATNTTNINKYNFTADITLTNVINTINNVSIPVTLNNTNINRITIVPVESNNTAIESDDDKCCIVIYPRTCDQSGCYVRRHRECSSICTEQVITVTTVRPTWPTVPPCPVNPCSIPPPPQPCPLQNATSKPANSSGVTPIPCNPNPSSAGCNLPLQPQSPCSSLQHVPPLPPTWMQTPMQAPMQAPMPPSYMPLPYIQPSNPLPVISQPQQQGCQYPYSYCGNYQTLNCQGCYFCNGRFNPQECAYSHECPIPCRAREQYYG